VSENLICLRAESSPDLRDRELLRDYLEVDQDPIRFALERQRKYGQFTVLNGEAAAEYLKSRNLPASSGQVVIMKRRWHG
jgi:hypothetical protein